MAEPILSGREALGQARPGRGVRRPNSATQGRRLATKWQALADAMEQRRATFAAALDGVDPELVLVFEIATTMDDFARAVARIPGFEYLAEIDEDDIDDSEDVFAPAEADDDAPRVTVPGTLFLMATNQQALTGVLDLWAQYQEDEAAPFPRGLGRWKSVFSYLLDVRRWSAQDRLRGTGVTQDFAQRAAAGQEVVPAELELWYRDDPERRAVAEADVTTAVEEVNGRVINRADIPGIAYHSLLVELPIQQIQPLMEGTPEDLALLRVEDLAFVRPQSMVSAIRDDESANAAPVRRSVGAPSGDPLVAVLDGVPLLGHALLGPHVRLDDPDGMQSEVVAEDRQHGTAMASCVVHGDLAGEDTPLKTPVYMRPVLVAEHNFDGTVVERIPPNVLAVDLIHRSVVRMFEGATATAPTVRIINLSLGDDTNPLATSLSPWARLLDWLSHRYGIVFVVSAGNQRAPIALPFTADELGRLDERQRRRAALRSLGSAAHERRLLSPAESVNALTVGASHDDHAGAPTLGARIDLLPNAPVGAQAPPSLISSVGLGYRKGIKPDLLAPGGRVLYRPESLMPNVRPLILRPSPAKIAGPGVTVAAPGTSGTLDEEWFAYGTSVAAAITTHHLARALETLTSLRDSNGQPLPGRNLAVAAKTLAVHTARIPQEGRAELESVLSETVTAHKMRSAVARFYGYGVLDPRRLTDGLLTRVTLLGVGQLLPDEGNRYTVPLPPSLSGYVGDRALTITVGSLVPIRSRDHRHRASEVYFRPDLTGLVVARQDADSNQVRKGSMQHEVLRGNRAALFRDGDTLAITVSCRSLVGSHRDPSLYAIAVTMEVPEETQLPLYAEVETRLRAQVAAARARI